MVNYTQLYNAAALNVIAGFMGGSMSGLGKALKDDVSRANAINQLKNILWDEVGASLTAGDVAFAEWLLDEE